MTPISTHYFSLSKRTFDFSLAIFLAIFLSPLLLLIAITILISSGMPIIFTQKRTGKDGKTFTIYKFRTLKKNASLLKHKYLEFNEAPSPMFKIHNDPRFVGIGKLLSQSGFDELPQLVNIIKGEMSFVGPRPLPVQEAASLNQNWKSFREQVKPGVFSEWTLSSNRHSTLKKWQELEEKTLSYSNLKNDLEVMIKVMLKQHNP